VGGDYKTTGKEFHHREHRRKFIF